jgi:hypothetical protein
MNGKIFSRGVGIMTMALLLGAMALLLGTSAGADEIRSDKAARGSSKAVAVSAASGKGDKANRELKLAMSEFSTELATFTSELPPQYRLSLNSDSAH